MKKRLYLIGTCIGYYDFFFGNRATEKVNRLCSFLQSVISTDPNMYMGLMHRLARGEISL